MWCLMQSQDIFQTSKKLIEICKQVFWIINEHSDIQLKNKVKDLLVSRWIDHFFKLSFDIAVKANLDQW